MIRKVPISGTIILGQFSFGVVRITELENSTIQIRYTFSFPDETSAQFIISLDPETLAYIETHDVTSLPEWTKLEHCQCKVCPLNTDEVDHCPIAANIAPIIDELKEEISYTDVMVTMESNQRKIVKQTSMQNGLSAVLGLVMVTSGCPIMDRLRPMATTHMPFMSMDESTYRMISMYLLAQYIRFRQGLEPDWALEKFAELEEKIDDVNTNIWKRLTSIDIQDASLNAVVALNAKSKYTSMVKDMDWMDKMADLFIRQGHWDKNEGEEA